MNRSWLDQSHYLSFPPLHFRRIATNRVTTAIPFFFFFFQTSPGRADDFTGGPFSFNSRLTRLLFQGCLSIIPSTRNRNSKPMLARIFATGQVIHTFLPFSPFFALFFSSSLSSSLPLFPSVSKRAKTAKCAVKQTSRERRGEKWNFQRRRSVETGQMGFRSTQMTGALIAFLLLFSPPPLPSSSSSGPARVICSVPTVVCAR